MSTKFGILLKLLMRALVRLMNLINLLGHRYEFFKMNDSKSFLGIFTCFTDIVITLLTRIFQMSSWSTKSSYLFQGARNQRFTVILEAKDLTKFEVNQLSGSLITHEMINSNNDDQKKKVPTLQASANEC